MLYLLVSCTEYGFVEPEKAVYPVRPQPELPFEAVTDTYSAREVPPRDVLLVVDDSGSMSDDRGRLMNGIDDLAGPLEWSGIDVRIAVTSTSCFPWDDAHHNCDATVVIDSGPGLRQALWQTLSAMPVGFGSSTEMPYLATYDALTAAAGWRRHVPLDIFLLTDEPDSTPWEYLTTAELNAQLQAEAQYRAAWRWPENARGGMGWVSLTSIVPLSFGDLCTPMYDPSEFEALSAAWGGTVEDLCGADWWPVLDVVLPSETTIHLSRQPVESSISVHVDWGAGEIVLDPSAWTYDEVENAVDVFVMPPPTAWVTYVADR